jgi:thiazole synthase
MENSVNNTALAVAAEVKPPGLVNPVSTAIAHGNPWRVAGIQLHSRFFLGTSHYPSPQVLSDAVAASGTEVLTVGLRRLQPESGGGNSFWQRIQSLGCHILPNTAGCHSAEEAVTLAQMAREIFGTSWIKLEVIGDDYTLQPDTHATLEAATALARDGFDVFAYTTDDLVIAQKLAGAGCAAVMPWAAPIGTGRGPLNPSALETMRRRLPDAVLIVDAGLGRPSHAAAVMELGFDAVLLNTAVAQAGDPVRMARAFADGVAAGRAAYVSTPMPERAAAQASTSTVGMPFWHNP